MIQWVTQSPERTWLVFSSFAKDSFPSSKWPFSVIHFYDNSGADIKNSIFKCEFYVHLIWLIRLEVMLSSGFFLNCVLPFRWGEWLIKCLAIVFNLLIENSVVVSSFTTACMYIILRPSCEIYSQILALMLLCKSDLPFLCSTEASDLVLMSFTDSLALHLSRTLSSSCSRPSYVHLCLTFFLFFSFLSLPPAVFTFHSRPPE